MGSITAGEAQVAKKPYRNNTAGWLGVVKLDHLGAQVGHSVKPYGTVYLSDDEAILTARAPQSPKDNPFEEQTFQFLNEEGQQVEAPMRPLVLITDDREVPHDERFVPSAPVTDEGAAARQRDAEAALAAQSDRAVATSPSEPTLVPSSGAAVPPSHATRVGAPQPAAPQPPEDDLAADGERRSSWVDNPERTDEPQPGSLGGSNEPAPAPSQEEPGRDGSPTAEPKQQPAPQPPVQPDVQGQRTVPSESAGVAEGAGSPSEQGGEEHAAHLESGEETGAAQTPAGDAPEGEFASHEEVGSPDAPSQVGS